MTMNVVKRVAVTWKMTTLMRMHNLKLKVKILTTVELAKISKILIALVTYNTPVLLHIVN